MVATPFIGKYSDIWPKRRSMLIAQIVSILSLITFFLVNNMLGRVELYVVFVLVSILQLCDALFGLTLYTSAKSIVDDPKDINQFNGIVNTYGGICSIIAPLAGGALVDILPLNTFILAEIAIEAFAVLFIYMIRLRTNDKNKVFEILAKEASALSVREVLVYTYKNKTLFLMNISYIFMNLFGGAMGIGLPFILATKFENQSFLIGLIKFAMPVGMIIVSSIYGKFSFNPMFYRSLIAL